jgi:arylsulfatase A-like enzyme
LAPKISFPGGDGRWLFCEEVIGTGAFMRVIFVLFDSLNRLAMGCYGSRIPTPNFDRFAARAVTFDKHYVGSLPCMPARRDIHTGRLNFPHRSWGPLEPFDNSFAEILKHRGVHTHLVTDHAHYFEEGGATYHTRYSTWDFIRGQENDPWKAMVQPPLERFREKYDQRHYPFGNEIDASSAMRLQHAVNREYMREEKDYPGPRCFTSALEFLEANRASDNWFLQIECFDPHEPFDAPERFRKAYDTGWNGGVLNWPYYEHVTDGAEEIAEIRANYAALVAMCDDYFGRLLDFMDEAGMWEDTVLVLTTDHGFLLSEHDWWGKNLQPYYEEISHIPLIVHHPAFAAQAGERRQELTQTYDLMPTILDAFGIAPPVEVQGRSVFAAMRGEGGGREVGIFGMFGGPVGATDGRYAYYLYPEDLYAPGLHEYTLMPMHIRSMMTAAELSTAELVRGFGFTKEMPIMRIDALRDARRIPNVDRRVFENRGTQLFDLTNDPRQERPFRDETVERRLREGIRAVLQGHDAPAEIYARYRLEDI